MKSRLHSIPNQILTFSGVTYIKFPMRPTINSKKPDGTDTQDSGEIADVFNEHFSSGFTLSENNTVPQSHLDREVSPITEDDINADIVYNKLISLKTNESPGPDGLPILALRETALQISVPPAIIFLKIS